MRLLLRLSLIAVNQVLGDRAGPLAAFLDDRFGDHAGRAGEALYRANDRAWRTLELAIGGESWWRSCAGMLAPAEEKSLERQVRAFLGSLPPATLPGDPEAFRREVRAEIQAARRVRLIPGERLSADDRAALAADVSRQVDAGRAALAGVAGQLRREGYARLATYVELRPAGGQPLLASAVRYFFRREVENDPRLAAGLTADRLEGLGAAQRDGFDQLHRAMNDHGGRLEGLLSEAVELARETRADAAATRGGVDALLEQVAALTRMVETLTADRQPAARIEQATARLAEVSRAYETAREMSGLPIYPPTQTTPVAPTPLLSALFTATPPPTPEATPPAVPPKPSLLSPLFRPKTDS